MLCGTLGNFSLQKKLRCWVMLSQAVNSIMHLQYGCSVRKHFTLKLKKIRHKTLKVISNIGDSYNSLLLHSSYVSIDQRHFDFQRYSKAYLKSIQNLSGRSLSRKRERDLFQTLFIFEIFLYGTTFLLKLNPGIHFSIQNQS